MTDKVFAIITLSISGMFAVLVSIITNVLAHRTDRSKRLQEAKQLKLECIRQMYVGALTVLERLVRQGGTGAQEDAKQIVATYAKLDLYSNKEIREQFSKAGDSIDRWAGEFRAGQPKRIAGGVLIGSPDTPHREKAEKMFPEVEREMLLLKEAMRSHLAQLDRDLGL